MFRPLVALSALALIASGCGCGNTVLTPCSTDLDCATTERCLAGRCQNPNAAGGGSGTGGGNGGTAGGSTIVTGCNPADTNNGTRDTDCDGLSDYDEYMIAYGMNARTDPCNSDSDGDGISDGVEMGKTATVASGCGARFVPDVEPGSKTDPTVADTDGDMLSDGAEDKNHDGKVDPGESNPLKRDSDCDGIDDKAERDGTLGCMTDPLKLDSDSDGLPDGVEQGVQAPGADPGMLPLHCVYAGNMFDAEPATKTNACGADSDMDGIQDGAEDANQNGRVDMGELSPTNAMDGMGPAQQACALTNLKPITFQIAPGADIQVALVPEFTEVVQLTDAMGNRGIAFYDSMHQVAGIAIDDQRTNGFASGTAIETYARGVLQPIGALSLPITQTFTTWDGFAQSVRAQYDQAGAADLKDRVNSIITAFGAMGALNGTAGATGPFKIQAEYVRRAATRSIILIAITPAAGFAGQRLFTLEDTGGGSALAQFGDYAGVTCEVFDSTINAKVDFLWVVDDSGSMQTSQAAVGNTGAQFGAKLGSAGLDWHVAGVSTSNSMRAVTQDIPTMQGWFTNASSTWFGISGSGIERTYDAVQFAVGQLLPRTTMNPAPPAVPPNKFRDGAAIHIISLTDTSDQSADTIAAFNQFLMNIDGMGNRAVMHGIICPEGAECGDGVTVGSPGRIHEAIRATGGVIGDIRVAINNAAQLGVYIDAILAAAIGGTGHQLQKPPISATIKVAMEPNSTRGVCDTNNVPRDRTNGWDFDAASRRIVFYGNCIPNAVGKKIAVSYRFWNDGSPDPGGDPCNNTCIAPNACDPTSAMCVCPSNCGGACTGTTVCEPISCTCVPGIG